MDILKIFSLFSTKDKKFFPLLEKASANLVELTKVLQLVVSVTDMDKRSEHIREIERLEHVGDDITHNVFVELGKTFITPFDREDIHELTSAIDDILDYVHGSVKRISMYKIQKVSPDFIKLSELILKASEELNIAVCELHNMKRLNKIQEACIKINSIENHADDIFDSAVARLFEEETNAIELIKYKEILSALETATDKCEDAANVLETIMIKNS